jgi:DNA-binding transcriptional LysR family regulator
VPLFWRTKHGVELTEAGETLLEGARKALLLVERTARAAREADGAEKDNLRFGFPEYANHTPLADILQTFQRRYPYVELEEHEMFTLQETQQVRELRDGALDAAFLLALVDDDALAFERVLEIELVVAVPMDHPFAAWGEVPMRELAGERIILFSRRFHPGCYDYIVGCCREAGFDPNVAQRNEPQLYSGATTYRMVASGAGVAIVARPLVSMFRPVGVVFKPLREPRPMLDLVVAWRREDPSSNLQAFLEVVRELAPIGGAGASLAPSPGDPAET